MTVVGLPRSGSLISGWMWSGITTRVADLYRAQTWVAHPLRSHFAKGWAPRTTTSHARRISSSMRWRRMRLARVWYPLPGFFSQAMTSASSRRETACFTGR